MRRSDLRLLFLLLILGWGNLHAQIYLDSTASTDERVADLLSRMSLDEKLGQMTQADRGGLTATSHIRDRYLGSILSGGGSAPANNTPSGWADLYDSFQALALQTPLHIPLIYGIDAVHGHNNVPGAVIFPHNIGLGATWDPELVQETQRITAAEVAGTGIDWTFAPCIAVPRDERWGRTYEGFGETAEITALMATAAVRGLQGDSLTDRASIAACAKHFVGDGATTGGEDQGNAQISEDSLRAIHLPGYLAALEAGAATVMASYSSWNGQKMHGNAYLLTDVLKGELGFQGFVVSDWNGIDQLPGNYTEDVRQSILAGIDMVMVPDAYETFINTLRGLVQNGDVPLSRINDAVSRILRVKFELGLFEHPFTQRSLTSQIGSTEHRAVARQAVRESMVILKKENGVLPLNPSTGTILVAGSHADNMGNQCGGWTISWQGSSGDITPGTTILEGLQERVSGAEIVYAVNGEYSGAADVGLVVIGEAPYAEGVGDDEDLHLSSSAVETIRRVKSRGIPTIVLLLSGRPMIVDNILHDADVLMAGWLPGTEGAGVADVLFGDFEPSGRLTHSWPRSMDQIPLNWGDLDYDPLYPYQHGIQSLTDSGPEIPPQFQSAQLRKSGDTLEVAFDKAMDPDSEAPGFVVATETSTTTILDLLVLEADPHTLVLILEAPLNAGEMIQISYAPGNVAALDGSLLAAFGPETVYNLRNEGSGAQPIPGRVEAENYTTAVGVDLEPTSDIGGGFNVGWIDATDWMEYELLVPDSGTYEVTLRVAAANQQGRLGFVKDGALQTLVDIPVTGGWQTWESITASVDLNAGLERVKLFAFIGGFNLNWLDFVGAVNIDPENQIPQTCTLFPVYPNPFNASTVIRYTLPTAGQVTLSVYDTRGRLVQALFQGHQEAGAKQELWAPTTLASGPYFIYLQVGQQQHIQKCLILK